MLLKLLVLLRQGPNANPSYQAGSQNANPSYQAGIQVAGTRGPVPSQFPGSVHMMPQVVAPTPGPRGFTPINNTEVQRSGMGHTQTPPAPAPVAPPAPPPTVQTVDTSNVPGNIFSLSLSFSSKGKGELHNLCKITY